MKIYRTVKTSIRALRRNPMRAMLTTLGIVIGVGSVIAMMEIGAGSSAAVRKTISSMGANVLNVRPGAASSGGVTFGSGSVKTLTPDDCVAIQRECLAVRSASPLVHTRAQVVYGNRNWVPTYIYGVTPAYLDVQGWAIAEGEPFTQRDVLNANKVCVLGQTLVHELFQDESPLGKEIRIKNVSFRVVGVLGTKGANMMGMDQDDMVMAPWTTVKYRVTGASLDEGNQSLSSGGSSSSVNTLSNLYPGVSWPVFDMGRIRSNIELQKALQEQDVIAYRQTGLTALQEVENALIASTKEEEHLKTLARAVTFNEKAVELATKLYTLGHTDFLNVLTAQRSLYFSEDALVQSTGAVSTYLVALYKALGGGWDQAKEQGNEAVDH